MQNDTHTFREGEGGGGGGAIEQFCHHSVLNTPHVAGEGERFV